MLILVYVLAVLVSLVFERQERRHLFYESLEYQRIGKEPPQPKPKLPLIESWLNVTIGILLFFIGFSAVYVRLFVVWTTSQIDATERTMFREEMMYWGVFIAAGIALIILGLKSVRFHKRLDKKMKTG